MSYLRRIGYEHHPDVSIDTLKGMHRSHFLHVPFENLSIQRSEKIVVEPDSIYEKVVARGRGGFCLELSGLFAWALREIGFQVDVLGGRVIGPGGTLGPAHEHMALLVHPPQPGDGAWLADVGFGGQIPVPLRLEERGPQEALGRTCTVANDGDHWLVTASEPWSGEPPGTYLMTLQPRTFDEFAPACDWLQTSSDSWFTQGDLVTLPREQGRITYAGGRLITTTSAGREEEEVAPGELSDVLRKQFGLQL